MSSPIEQSKRTAARQAVDEYVKSGFVVGVGSGSTVVYAAERLGELVKEKKLTDIKCIPTSFQAKQLIAQHKLTLSSLDENPVIDVTIDGADEVDLQLNCIKGGGGCQLQEKIVAFAAKKFVVIADYRKESKQLGEQWTLGVPVEVIPMAYVPLMNKMEQDFGGKSVLRMAKSKAGPVVTDNGNFVVDVNFGVISDPKTLCDRLKLLPGVVEVGLFCGMAEKAFFGQTDGSFTTRVAAHKSA
ncbi:ribose 5-phosphate isomerase A [Phytophthora nicotianae P10297]|uniref:Ribose-5-phosphate isomerase n=3 Tax=Phytophthora nicotianae TaxID=4792 RepID=W2R2Q8_PHYN3|nr:ribose 5-phosphate isomerase A [Phytophthora nicotianae INRA-310]ETN19536.1 ribose 5-phosphate isomerase A [Phytophthora nicotianae INRA-310]ETP36440.1 ribose 5-phosphate isomerase A [Phytophthora nicotianae P10297]KUF83112.1 Ribose-5-phosphate isomerase [Phytophthora nicotianae]